jgi:predicted lipase
VLPELTATVTLIQERVQGLCSSISKIEAALTQMNEDTVAHQISMWKVQESAKVDEYERKREAELRDLEAKMRKSREVVDDERKQKALSRSKSIEKEAEKETDRVRAQLDQQVQKSMEDYLIYGGFGSSGRKAPTEGTPMKK